MITIKCDKRNAQSERLELLTSGSAGIQVRFEFSPEWEGLNIAPCFCCGDPNDPTQIRTVQLVDGECCVPQEVLETAGKAVWAGAYGYSADGRVIIPTVWTLMGICRRGVDPDAAPGTDPTLPVWAQIEAMIGDLDDLDTEEKSSLVAAINEAAQSGGAALDATLSTSGMAADAKAVGDALDAVDGSLAGKADLSDISDVGLSNDYNDLDNKPTIPTVNNATLTIKQGGTTKGTFSANASANVEINLDAGGGSDYLPLSGGEMSGNIVFEYGSGKGIYFDDIDAGIKSDGWDVAVMHGSLLAPIKVDTPADNDHAANKGYVDSAIAAAIGDAIGGAY